MSDDELLSDGEFYDDDDYDAPRKGPPKEFNPFICDDEGHSTSSWCYRDTDEDDWEPATTLPVEWQFLHKWFAKLRLAKLTIQDPERLDTPHASIGRTADDWWLSFRFLPTSPVYYHRKHYIKHYHTTREAILLTTVLAEVDYDAWKKELDVVAKFTVPAKFGMPIGRLERKFAVGFSDLTGLNEYDWTKMQDIFGTRVLSKEFKTDMAQAVRVAAAKGVDVSKMAPIPVRIAVTNRGGQHKSHMKGIEGVTKMVVGMRELEEKNRGLQQAGSKKAKLVFKLDAIELQLFDCDFHEEVFDELQHLLNTGVEVLSLTPPCLAYYEDRPEMIAAWSSFVRAVCGLIPRRSTRVRHLQLCRPRVFDPAPFLRPCYLAPIFSAVTNTQSLRSIRVYGGVFDNATSNHKTVWAWLVYALFSAASTSSIEALDFQLFELDKEAMDIVSAIMNAQDPLGYLYEHLTGRKGLQESGKCPLRSHVTVRESAKVQLLGPGGVDEYVVALESSYDAVVMVDESRQSTLDVFLPGLGFGRILCQSVSNKRPREAEDGAASPGVASRSRGLVRLRSLNLKLSQRVSRGVDYFADSHHAQLLRLMRALKMSDLRHLQLSAPALNEDCISACLRTCPNLQSVGIRGVELKSLDIFSKLAENQMCQVSSLALKDVCVPIVAFESFLRLFLDDSAIKKTLKKLRIINDTHIPLRQSTADLIAEVLDDRGTLQHLDILQPSDFSDQKLRLEWDIQKYHRQLLHGPLALRPRLAFLSAGGRRFGSAFMNERVAGRIMSFAAPFVVERTVHLERPRWDF